MPRADGEGSVTVPGERADDVPLAFVCAVDDSVGLWPRYVDLMSDDSYEEEPPCPA